MYNYNSLFLFHLVTCIPVNRNNESTWEGCVVLFAVGGYPVGVAIAHKRKMLVKSFFFSKIGLHHFYIEGELEAKKNREIY